MNRLARLLGGSCVRRSLRLESLEPRILLDAALPDFGWAVAVGADGGATASDIAVDASGDVHITGSFRGTVDFDPGPGTFDLSSADDADIFVAKLTSSGNLLWARAMGGPGADQANGVAVDGSGNVYTAGRFESTADFDPGPGSYGLAAAGTDVFVSKLDSSGNFGWASALAGWGGHDDEAYDIAVDASGNVYTTGKLTYVKYHWSDDPFGQPGPPREASDPGAFVAKHGPSGDLAWSIRPATVVMANSVATDASGNVYILDDATEDPAFGAPSESIAISKLDSSGNALWGATIGGDSSQAAGGIAVDDSGNLYVTGSFRGTIDFDPGPEMFELTGPSTEDSSDGFVLKLDTSGGFVWATAMASGGSPSSARGQGVAVDQWGGVYTTGWFSDTVDFDPGPGTFELTGTGLDDIFVSKLDPTGSFVWAGAMAGAGASDPGRGENVAVDPSGNVYATGYFAGTTDFDPGPGAFDLAAPVDSFFVLRLSPRPVTIAGTVWNDLDGDGSRDGGDTGIDGATVILFHDNGDGVFEPGGADAQLASRLTAGGGTYSFTDLMPGHYWVDVDAPLLAGFALASGAEPLLVRLDLGDQVSSADFGYHSIQVTLQAEDPDAGEAGPDAGTFRITRTGPTHSALTVHFAISGSATSGVDYQGVVTPVVIPAGQSSASALVQPIDDDLVEGEETVVLTLVDDPAYHVGAPDTATVTIAEDDALPIAIDDVQVTERNTGATADAVFTLTLAEDPLVPVQVTYSTAAGTATEGVDYQRTSGTITFTPGQALTRTISVSVAGDGDLEHRETFFVNLTIDLGAPMADSQAQGTILDDDGVFVDFGGGTKAQFTDADGDPVSVQLRGPGAGTLRLPAADGADAFDIVLNGTDAESSLTILTQGRGSETTLAGLLILASCGAVTASTTDLLGDVRVVGSLGRLTLDDVAGGHTITVGPTLHTKARLT
ncbi:SBBP repeat-containing protein, partial [bacterium]|nr:SBBP repeat-containing protein [bacterium]